MAKTNVRGTQILDGSVDLTVDVTGITPVANGGTGVGTLTGLVKGNGTSVMTAVTAPSGAVVGDSDAQTLTNKTLTGPKVDEIKGTSGNRILLLADAGATGDYLQCANFAGAPAFEAKGSSTNIGIVFTPKGGASLGQYLATAQTTGRFQVDGTATNIDLDLLPKGTGVVKANGVEVATISGTQTLTNKRITPRVVSVSNTTSYTINSDTTDVAENTGLTGAVTINNPTGTPTSFQKLWIALTGTAARAISYGTAFEDSTIVRPTTTSGTATLEIGFRWNATTSKWRCIGYA